MGTPYAEGEARELLRRAGFDTHDMPGILELARALLGASAVLSHTGLRAPAKYLPKQRQLWVRAGVNPRRARYLIAHELAEFWLLETGYSGDDFEAMCDAIASAIVCPRDAFRAGLRSFGLDLPQLAETFETSQSVVVLRFGEVTLTPVALATERHVHIRGEEFAWGDVRRLVRTGAPGLERRRMTDTLTRVALIAA
jgi:hypothetical protein